MEEQVLTQEISEKFFHLGALFYHSILNESTTEKTAEEIIKKINSWKTDILAQTNSFVERFSAKLTKHTNLDYYGRVTYFLLTFSQELKSQIERWHKWIIEVIKGKILSSE